MLTKWSRTRAPWVVLNVFVFDCGCHRDLLISLIKIIHCSIIEFIVIVLWFLLFVYRYVHICINRVQLVLCAIYWFFFFSFLFFDECWHRYRLCLYKWRIWKWYGRLKYSIFIAYFTSVKLAPDSSFLWKDSPVSLCWLSFRLCYMQDLILHRMVRFSDRATEGKHEVLLKILIFFSFFYKFLSSRFTILLVLLLKMIVLNSKLNSTYSTTKKRVSTNL